MEKKFDIEKQINILLKAKSMRFKDARDFATLAILKEHLKEIKEAKLYIHESVLETSIEAEAFYVQNLNSEDIPIRKMVTLKWHPIEQRFKFVVSAAFNVNANDENESTNFHCFEMWSHYVEDMTTYQILVWYPVIEVILNQFADWCENGIKNLEEAAKSSI